MDMCRCYVSIAGDLRHVVVRDAHNPVSWPEVLILKMIHGDRAITKIEVIKSVDSTSEQEKSRLASIYGMGKVNAMFPGYGVQLPLNAPPEFGGSGQPMQAQPTDTPFDPPPKRGPGRPRKES